MITLDSLLTHVTPKACSMMPNEIKRELILTIRDFCMKTKCWVVYLQDMRVNPNDATYHLCPPDDTDMISVEQVYYQNTELKPKSLLEMATFYQEEGGDPRFYYTENRTKLLLNPVPEREVDAGLNRIKASVMPSITADKVSGMFGSYYFEAITDGTLARIFATQGDQYDPVLSNNHSNLYRECVTAANIDLNTSGVNATLVASNPNFSNRRHRR